LTFDFNCFIIVVQVYEIGGKRWLAGLRNSQSEPVGFSP
jgi:hypothetical protein